MRHRTAFQLSDSDAQFLASLGVTATEPSADSNVTTHTPQRSREPGDSTDGMAKLQEFIRETRRNAAEDYRRKMLISCSGGWGVIHSSPANGATGRLSRCRSPLLTKRCDVDLDCERTPRRGDVVLLSEPDRYDGVIPHFVPRFAYIVRVEASGALQVRFRPGAPIGRINAGDLKYGMTRIEGVVDDPASFQWE